MPSLRWPSLIAQKKARVLLHIMSNQSGSEDCPSTVSHPKWKEDLAELEDIVSDTFGVRAIWKFLKKRWHIMKENWLLCALLVMVGGFGGYWIGKHSATATSTATTSVEWPALTQVQIAEWTRDLKPFQIKEILITYAIDAKTKKFLKSVETVGNNLNFEVLPVPRTYSDVPYVTIRSSDVQVASTLKELFKPVYPAEVVPTTQAESQGRVNIDLPDKD